MRDYRIKVLVVVNHKSVSRMICNWLTSQGNSIFVCHNSQRLYNDYKRIQPDVVIVSKGQEGINTDVLCQYVERNNQGIVHYIKIDKIMLDTLNTGDISLGHLPFIKDIKKTINKVKQDKLSKKTDKSKILLQAKHSLMNKKKCSEKQAYEYMRKMSMDNCVPMQVLAQSIIESTR